MAWHFHVLFLVQSIRSRSESIDAFKQFLADRIFICDNRVDMAGAFFENHYSSENLYIDASYKLCSGNEARFKYEKK